MTKNQIIEYIAKNNILKNLIHNIGGTIDDSLEDLEQDIYLNLFTKDEKTLNNLYNNGHLTFYLAKIVTNNIHSTTSRYYTTYKKPLLINTDIINIDEDTDDDTTD